MNDNLKPFNTLPTEEHKALSVKGGKASVIKRREKAQLKNALEMLLSKGLTKEQKQELKEKGINEKGLTLNDLLGYRLLEQALKGNIRAIELIAHLTEQDIETQAKRQELDLKERSLALKENGKGTALSDYVINVNIIGSEETPNLEEQTGNIKALEVEKENIIVNVL